MFTRLINWLGVVCVLTAGAALAQQQPTPNPNQPQLVPPVNWFQNQMHMRLVIPCSNQLGSLDRYLRNEQNQKPLFMAKGINHLLMAAPQGTGDLEVRAVSGVIVYTDGKYENSQWSLIVVYENGVECLMTVGENFQPWIEN